MITTDGITLKAALEKWSASELPRGATEFLPELAASLLMAGYDRPEVVGLAACEWNDDPEDLRKAAARAFAALGLDTDAEGLHEIVRGRRVAEQLLAEEIPQEEGLREMVFLWRLTCHSERFAEWNYLYEAICLFRDGYGGLEPFLSLTEENIPGTIRMLAQQFLQNHALPLRPGARLL